MANFVAWGKDLERRLSQTPEYLAEGLAFELSLEIYRQMQEAGLSQTAFARQLGVSKAYVSQILGGKTNLTILSLAKIAKALGADLSVTLQARRKSQTITRSRSARPASSAVGSRGPGRARVSWTPALSARRRRKAGGGKAEGTGAHTRPEARASGQD